MKITWLGHACFLLENEKGTKLVIDPFNPKIGYPAPAVFADIITKSHEHHDHNAVDQVKGDFTIVSSTDKQPVKDFTISGLKTYHDQEKGALRGENKIFKYEADGLTLVHCGDLGHILEDDQIAKLGEVDILFIPVGSVYTIDGEKAYNLVKKINPKITIPMHYKTEQLNIDLRPVDDFLSFIDEFQQEDSNKIEINLHNINNLSPVVVLLPPKINSNS